MYVLNLRRKRSPTQSSETDAILVVRFVGIAWLVISQKWDFTFLSEMIEIDSWRVFLVICSLPEFLACIALFAFPESPRFLILKSRHDEALDVFKKIYSLNTGKDPDTYPVIHVRVMTLYSRSIVNVTTCSEGIESLRVSL